MMRVYVMMALVGWAWAAAFGIYLLIRRPRAERRGFEVVQGHEKQP